MKFRSGRVLLAAVAAALVAWSAAADDVGGENAAVPSGGSTVVEQLLDIMLASGQITQQQYDALKSKAREEQEEAAVAIVQAARETPEVSEQGPTWNFKWKNKFRLERSDGAFKLGFGGRIMIDQASIWESNGLRNVPGSRDGTGVECRRCRIFFDGTVYDRVIFKAAYDFQDDDNPEFKDIWIGLKDLGFVERIQLGQFKEPFNLEEWTSSKYLTFMERGLNNVFFPGRNVGVAFMGNLVGKRMYWQTGLFYDVNDRAFAFDDWGRQQYDLSARLVGTPIYSDDGTKVLHLGAGYIHQFRDKDSASFRYRQQPESHLAARFADTGVLLGVDGTDVFDIELAGVFGPFSAQAEFTGPR